MNIILLLLSIFVTIVCVLQVWIILLLTKILKQKKQDIKQEDILKCFINQDSGRHTAYY